MGFGVTFGRVFAPTFDRRAAAAPVGWLSYEREKWRSISNLDH